MTRDAATPILQAYWKDVERFDRKYAETGDENYMYQANHMRRLCMEVMDRVVKHEA